MNLTIFICQHDSFVQVKNPVCGNWEEECGRECPKIVLPKNLQCFEKVQVDECDCDVMPNKKACVAIPEGYCKPGNDDCKIWILYVPEYLFICVSRHARIWSMSIFVFWSILLYCRHSRNILALYLHTTFDLKHPSHCKIRPSTKLSLIFLSQDSRSAILWMLATANIRLVVLAPKFLQLLLAPNAKDRISPPKMDANLR